VKDGKEVRILTGTNCTHLQPDQCYRGIIHHPKIQRHCTFYSCRPRSTNAVLNWKESQTIHCNV